MGWWKISNKGIKAWKDNGQELTSEDLDHINELIKEGYTEGELVDFEEEKTEKRPSIKTPRKPKGWHYESARHALAAKKIKTGRKIKFSKIKSIGGTKVYFYKEKVGTVKPKGMIITAFRGKRTPSRSGYLAEYGILSSKINPAQAQEKLSKYLEKKLNK
jgi:hypothetical protein